MQTNRVAGITGEVRAEIARQGVTLGTLSVTTGLGVSGLSRRLNGKTEITLTELDVVCHALGVTFSDLAQRADAHSQVAS